MATKVRIDLVECDELPGKGWLIETVEIPARSMRRHHRERMKAKAKRFMIEIWKFEAEKIDARRIGHMEATHCRPCSCSMCRSDENPRHNDVKRILAGMEV